MRRYQLRHHRRRRYSTHRRRRAAVPRRDPHHCTHTATQLAVNCRCCSYDRHTRTTDTVVAAAVAALQMAIVTADEAALRGVHRRHRRCHRYTHPWACQVCRRCGSHRYGNLCCRRRSMRQLGTVPLQGVAACRWSSDEGLFQLPCHHSRALRAPPVTLLPSQPPPMDSIFTQ